MLVDEVVILVKGGDGGSGRISFKRNAQTARGGPDGGNGGNGGSLYFEGVDDFTVLSQFTYTKSVLAENGVNGGKQNLYGRNGEDRIVKVPVGTEILDLITNEVLEIKQKGEKILIARGGKGGRGNNEFKSATVQAPKYREVGEKGEERQLKLQLKLIADIGLIGLPNAGKSSLLEVLTNAHPKIGDYPFTTLEPNLGVAGGLVLADIPGLIEGASGGKGLGIKFLKHIERTKLLVHCIDSSSKNVLEDYKIIRKELKIYSAGLIEKPEIVLLTKSDLIEKKEIERKLSQIKKENIDCFAISIYSEEELNSLKKSLLT